MNAVVMPHPGQSKPKTDFHKHGKQILIPLVNFRMIEKKK
jgi:hypothetical protein